MIVSTSIAIALSASLLATETTPKPGLKTASFVSGPKSQIPLDLVPAAGGAHYAVYSKADNLGWPELWIDRYRANGTREWSHYHEIYRTPAGNGFDAVRATATDYLGTLYLRYYTLLNGGFSEIVKLSADNSLAWEAKVKHPCRGHTTLLPLPGAAGLLMNCGTDLKRINPADGAQLWHKTGETALGRHHFAALDNYNNVFVLHRHEGPNSHGTNEEIALRKYSPDGTLLWRTSIPSPQYRHPTPIGAFVTGDHGLTAAVVETGSDGKHANIDVIRFNKHGAHLGTHRIETGIFIGISTGQPVIVRHDRPSDTVYLAWDDRKDYTPASEWVATSVKLEPPEPVVLAPRPASRSLHPKREPSASMTTSSPGPSDIAKAVQKWTGRTLLTTRIADDGHDFLVDMDVDSNGRMILVGTDQDQLKDYVRLTVLSRFAGGPHETTRYRRDDRHARPTHMLVHGNLIYVLGEDDDVAGPALGGDPDVLHLVFHKDVRKKKRFSKASKAAAKVKPTPRVFNK